MTLNHHDILAAAGMSPSQYGHDHFWTRALSRRGFIGVGASTAGAFVATQLLRPTRVLAEGGPEPKPIPGGPVPPPIGPHAWLPRRGNEPSSIFDFDGTVALADIVGSGKGGQGGLSGPLNFDVDMRFMTGKYTALDGVTREGAFGFFWLDLYAGPVVPGGPPGQPNQIHDYNPGIAKSGLFWTVAFPAEAVAADVAAGAASYKATNLACKDYGFLINSLVQGPSEPATVSWDLEWSGPTGYSRVNDSQNRFALDAVETKATINWSAIGPNGFSFTADPASSNTVYALVGKERNGSFFWWHQGVMARVPATLAWPVHGDGAFLIGRLVFDSRRLWAPWSPAETTTQSAGAVSQGDAHMAALERESWEAVLRSAPTEETPPSRGGWVWILEPDV